MMVVCWAWFKRGLVLMALAIGLLGCQSGVLPNPNSPTDMGLVDGGILLRNYNRHRVDLERRVQSREITTAQKQEMLKAWAKGMADTVAVESIPVDEAWQYGDVFRLAGDWEMALRLYQASRDWAKGENNLDRFVNDSLRASRCLAHLGRVPDAIALARTTFDVPPDQKAPILFAVLYEIVPEAKGKGSDVALAELVRDAARQHMETVVDPQTESGQAFLLTRLMHVRRARSEALDLLVRAGAQGKARETMDVFEAMTRREAQL